MNDAQRLDFLAELMDASARLELAPDCVPAEEADRLKVRSGIIFTRYELHRRTADTPTAFRLAVDDAAKQRSSKGNNE